MRASHELSEILEFEMLPTISDSLENTRFFVLRNGTKKLLKIFSF
jgi:hypothetical protein